MRHPVRTFSSASLLLICAGLSMAQDVAPANQGKDKDSVRIYRRYDKSKNETVTETGAMSLYLSTKSVLDQLDLNVLYTYPGQSPTMPQSVNLKIVSTHYELQYQQDLTIEADGEAFELGKMQYRRMATTDLEGFTGELSLTIPVGTFKRIAGAKEVRLKIGTLDVSLEKRHLKKMSGLVEAMTQ